MFLKLHELLNSAPHFTSLPSKKAEKWRFSPLHNYLDRVYKSVPAIEDLSFTPKEKFWLHLQDGQLVSENLPSSVHIKQHPRLCEISNNPFACLASSTALSPVELSCYEDLEFGLYLSYSDESFIGSSLNITLKDGVKASVYLSYTGGENSFISNAHHIKLSARAELTLVQSQKLSSKAVFITQNSLHLQEKASFKGFTLLYSGEYLHNFVQADLNYQSEVDITSLLLSSYAQKEIFSCDIKHLADSSKSKVLSKQVIKDASTCVFDANTTIVSGTKAAQAQQESHALLLSEQAHIHAKPHLEIYSDDLTASHGTTVGELDQEAIAYLTSRGIKEEKARSMLISAFVHETIESIENTRMQEHILDTLGETYAFV